MEYSINLNHFLLINLKIFNKIRTNTRFEFVVFVNKKFNLDIDSLLFGSYLYHVGTDMLTDFQKIQFGNFTLNSFS